MPQPKPTWIVRAALWWGGLMIAAPIAAVVICVLARDWRTYVVLAGMSLLAYLLVRHSRPVDRHRSGSIERAPYDITDARDRRREQ